MKRKERYKEISSLLLNNIETARAFQRLHQHADDAVGYVLAGSIARIEESRRLRLLDDKVIQLALDTIGYLIISNDPFGNAVANKYIESAIPDLGGKRTF
jgi:hypothetical protein